MKVAILTDTHYNFKKGNKTFHDYFEKFYKNIFFPTLKERNIDTVIHLGDIFDNRKSTDYWSIEWTKRVVLDPLKDYDVHAIIGNHDIFYKNTNKLNSPHLLLKDYKNIHTYAYSKEVNIDGREILFVPWIAPDEQERTISLIESTSAKVAMGHLELGGFYVHKGHLQETTRYDEYFKKFDRVLSGHYHTRSDDGRVYYIGNPYQMYWNDYNDNRGFIIFDTEDLSIEYINNPYEMFKIIYYDEDNLQKNLSEYENCIVKIIIKNKTNQKKYEKFFDSLLKVKPYELKVIENIVVNSDFDEEEFVLHEDTLSLLKKYVDESEIQLNKDKIKNMIHLIYQESFQM
jgi:DNA repair exonuclease SbcCD nuclease subunit